MREDKTEKSVIVNFLRKLKKKCLLSSVFALSEKTNVSFGNFTKINIFICKTLKENTRE
jgi:hypothetical protein